MSTPTSLQRDQNFVAVGGGIYDDGSGTIAPLSINHTTGRLKVTATISGISGLTWYQDEIVASGVTGTSFTLDHTPTTVVFLFKNGQYLVSGVGQDYTRSGANITLSVSLLSSDLLTANYS